MKKGIIYITLGLLILIIVGLDPLSTFISGANLALGLRIVYYHSKLKSYEQGSDTGDT